MQWFEVRCVPLILNNVLHTHIMGVGPLKIFQNSLKCKHFMKIAPFLENHVQQHTPQPDWESIKTEKWPIAYVCAFIIWLKCRAMLPFALGDRYGLKQACKHQQRVLVAHRKILRTTQRQTSRSQKHKFWGFQTTQSQKLPLSGYQIWKMTNSLRLCLYNLIEVLCDAPVCFGRQIWPQASLQTPTTSAGGKICITPPPAVFTQ